MAAPAMNTYMIPPISPNTSKISYAVLETVIPVGVKLKFS